MYTYQDCFHLVKLIGPLHASYKIATAVKTKESTPSCLVTIISFILFRYKAYMYTSTDSKQGLVTKGLNLGFGDKSVKPGAW